jgi:hypothetical protein
MESGALRLLRIGACATALTFAAAVGAADADTLSLTTSPASPTDAGPVQIVASGTTSSPSATVAVHYRAAGTGDCATSSDQDSATPVSPDGSNVSGTSFSVTGSPQQLPVGSYLVCGWLYDNEAGPNPPLAQSQIAITVSAADTLALWAPSNPVEGEPLDVTASGNAYDGNAEVDATIKPAGGSCAAAPPPADTGAPTNSSGGGVGGQVPYSTTVVSQQIFATGSYLVCAWLVDQATIQVLSAASTSFAVRPLEASLRLAAPTRVDPGQAFSPTITATVQAGIPVIAIVDYKQATAGAGCAANPAGEPTAATTVLDQSITDTQQPSGPVAVSDTSVLPATGRYLFCAWLLQGWTQSDNPPVVSGPVSTVVSVPPALVFRGRTSQRRWISFTVSAVGHLLEEILYADHFRCAGPATFPSGERWNGDWSSGLNTGTFGMVHIPRSGRLRLALNGNPAHTFNLKATLKGKRITGSFLEKGRVYALTGNTSQRALCSTGHVRFSATH